MRYFGFLSVLFGLISFFLIFIFIPENNLLISSLFYSAIGVLFVKNHSHETQKHSDIKTMVSWLGYVYFAISITFILIFFFYVSENHTQEQIQLYKSSELYRKKIELEEIKDPILFRYKHRIGMLNISILTFVSFIISNYIFNSFGRPSFTKLNKPLMAWFYNSLFILLMLTSCLGLLLTIGSIVVVYENSDEAISFSLIQYTGKGAILTLLSFYLAMDFAKRYIIEVDI
jgi:hypothetical protein